MVFTPYRESKGTFRCHRKNKESEILPVGRGLGVPRRGRGRSLQPPSPPQIGSGRARTRPVLYEMLERSHVQAHSPIFSQTGRGRGLRPPSPPHPRGRARARPLLQQIAPNPPSLARVWSRTPGPC